MKQKVVYVASRVRGKLQQNINDVKSYCRYCVLQGVVPIVPHLMYVGALNDADPTERKLGMDLGITILQAGFIDELWAFTDSEISKYAPVLATLLKNPTLILPQ